MSEKIVIDGKVVKVNPWDCGVHKLEKNGNKKAEEFCKQCDKCTVDGGK
jgi:hypothetical protein